jgi:hypothetical protein
MRSAPAAERQRQRAEKLPRRTAAEIAFDLERVDKIDPKQFSKFPIQGRRAVVAEHLYSVVLPRLGLPSVSPRELTETQLQDVFIEMYREFGSIGPARRLLGVRREIIEGWRKDLRFKARMADAYEDAIDDIEVEAWRRGVAGHDEMTTTIRPDYDHPGKTLTEVKSVRRFSDGLLQFMLRGSRPEKFKDRTEHSGDAAHPINFTSETKSDVISGIMALVKPKPDPQPEKRKPKK